MKQQTWEEELELLIRYYENGVMDYDTLETQKAIVRDEHFKAIEADLQRQREEFMAVIRKLQVTPQKDYLVEGYAMALDDIIKKVGKHD